MHTRRDVYVNDSLYCRVYTQRHYGFFNFMFDVVMSCITGGLWLIWIFVREMRNR